MPYALIVSCDDTAPDKQVISMIVSVPRLDVLPLALCLATTSSCASDPTSEPVITPAPTVKAESMAEAKAAAPAAKASASGQDTAAAAKAPDPWERQVFFGEQHLHTENSPDAFAAGSRQSWDATYEYAMGKEVTLATTTTSNKIKKSTPYDFVAITDHAEYFAVMPRLIDPTDALSKSDLGKQLQAEDPKAVEEILHSIITSTAMPEFVNPVLLHDNWQRYVKVANKYNDPGKFTTLIAFEWTSIPNGRNMHRNVFFRDDKGPDAPFSSFDSIFPQDLWTYQEIYRNGGTDNFAIPHNGNVSDGWMYSPRKFGYGEGLIDARYATRQQLNEPLTEIIQTKGQSDTHPAMSPNDEFAEFEIFPNMINVGHPSQIKNGFIRQALSVGLILENKVGTNPYKMGIVSGADSHSGYSNNEEFNFHGSHAALEDTPQKRLNPEPNASGDMPSRLGTAGTTAVWADENTRAGIFDGMKRKETYGTSGTLIRLRFFGGWDIPADLMDQPDWVQLAYTKGVPMGGDFLPREGKDLAKGATFAVQALKDPESGNLDRIQIIKCFINKWGGPGEKIYDVAWSDDRKPDPKTGDLPPVGNTVDVTKATYTNDIGDSQLAAVWSDPDFDPTQPAVYYVRVLEIPTPRWSTYDSVKTGLPIPKGIPATLQERAWSSPIWYTPDPSLVKKQAFYPGLKRRVR
jgi:hypothetical protein